MAWDWVAPAATGVVGVTSVVGTVVAARTSTIAADRAAVRARDYALEDVQRSERKETYVAFLSAANAIDRLAFRASSAAVDDAQSDDSITALEDMTLSAIADLTHWWYQVRLIADNEVVIAAEAVYASALDVIDAAANGRYTVIDGSIDSGFLRAAAKELALTLPAERTVSVDRP